MIHSLLNVVALLFVSLTVLAVLTSGGCHRPRPNAARIFVKGDSPFGEVRAKDRGECQWYSADRLDAIVRQYVRDEGIDFDFVGTEPNFWIGNMGWKYLAIGSYSSGVGRPVLTAKIGWDGTVKEVGLDHAVDTLEFDE